MTAENIDFAAEKKFILRFLNETFLLNESLHQLLEEQSIYWNDDLDFVVSMVEKTLKKFKEEDTEDKHLLDLYKNDEDRDFVIRLFRKSVLNRDFALELIGKKPATGISTGSPSWMF